MADEVLGQKTPVSEKPTEWVMRGVTSVFEERPTLIDWAFSIYATPV